MKHSHGVTSIERDVSHEIRDRRQSRKRPRSTGSSAHSNAFRSSREIHRSGTPKQQSSSNLCNSMSFSSLSPSSSTSLPIDNYLRDLLFRVTPSHEELESRHKAIESMRMALDSLGLEVKVYGSLITGLITPSSDIDMVMLPIENADIIKAASDKAQHIIHTVLSAAVEHPTSMQKAKISGCIRTVAATLRHGNRCFSRITTITRAKVPIVKCETASGPLPIKIDLSFDKSGLSTSAFLCKAFSKNGNELARAVTILVKILLASCDLNDPSVGGLGSFPTALMVLFFFETKVKDSIPEDLRKSIGVLFACFLKFYGIEFDYMYEGVDYVHLKTFRKAPTNSLFVVNPLSPGTNGASSATLFEHRIRPLFARMHSSLCRLLSPEESADRIASVLRSYLSTAHSEKRRTSGHARKPTQTNVWDSAGLYCGSYL